VRHDGDEGLFRAYDSVEFLEPVRAGDVLEVECELVSVGNTSRKLRFEARKVIELSRDPELAVSSADVLDPPVVVCRASGTCVVPTDCQRKRR
jgi:3-aminobutyryl-CoA ammonia-lyase